MNFKQAGIADRVAVFVVNWWKDVVMDVYYSIYTFKVKHQIKKLPIAERNEV